MAQESTRNGEANGTATHANGGVNDAATPPPPIAIVGMGLRLPGGVNSVDDFWDLLINKKDGASPIPPDRYKPEGFYSPHQKPGHIVMNQGYFLNHLDITHMDAAFFTMSKAEVERLDPQQRLLLEVVYEAFESAGETNWTGKDIGCYVGTFAEDWLDLHAKDSQDFGMYRITGSGDFVLANRVSYEYDLHGPSMTIKVGCSSAMLALHLACEALNKGDCSSAIVGGTNLLLSPALTMAMCEQGALSPDGSCKTFDADANGYARADAINAIYIKKLDDAIRDANPIRAVIRSTSSNCDGKTPGLSNPSSKAHEELIRQAYRFSGLDPADTAMCECHGTGTAVGDPLEVNAVANVWGEDGILIGSVKPNVGHSEGASGITSIIKTVLALENRTIIPNIKFKNPNPKIPWKSAKLTVPTEPLSWPEGREERISVNSFGIGGANVHTIIDSAASYLAKYRKPHGLTNGSANGTSNGTNGKHHDAKPELFVFSANHKDSLTKVVENAEEHYSQHKPPLRDMAYTLGARRKHLPFRTFAIADGKSPFDIFPPSSKKTQSSPPPVYVFTGQGAQWPQMGKELMEDYDSFFRDIQAMDKTLQNLKQCPSWSIQDELLKPKSESVLHLAEYSQPICTALQVALVNLLAKWGVQPSAVVGHSSGEIAAAYAAGCLTMEEAITVAFYRGLVTKQQKRPGGMAAIGLGRDDVLPLLRPGTTIACENSGGSVTISGDLEPLDALIDDIKQAYPDVLARKLQVEMAYHSDHMKEVGNVYETWMEGHVSPQRPKVPFFSTVFVKELDQAEHFLPSYWRANLESPVLFHSGVVAILNDDRLSGCPYLEIGPHSALAGPLRQIYKEKGVTKAYVSALARGKDSTKSILKAVGQLYTVGADIDFGAMNEHGVTLPNLPGYAWHHDVSYWSESRAMKAWRLRDIPHHDVLGSRITESSDMEPVWRNMLSLDHVPWIRDHLVHTDVVYPAAGYIAIAGAAVGQLPGSAGDYTVRSVTINAAMVIQQAKATEVITTLRPVRLTDVLDSHWYEFSIVSYNNGNWTQHCHGQVRSGAGARYPTQDVPSLPRKVPAAHWYRAMKRVGLEYGPAFTGLSDISAGVNKKQASATVIDSPKDEESPYQFHPVTLDLIFQMLSIAVFNGQSRTFDHLNLPTYIEELYIGHGARKQMRIHIDADVSARKVVTGSGHGITSDGDLAMYLKGLRLSPLESDDADRDTEPHAAVKLVWKPDIDALDVATLMHPMLDLSLLCAVESVLQLEGKTNLESHLGKYYQWLKKYTASEKNLLVPNATELVSLGSSDRRRQIEELNEAIKSTPGAAVGRGIYEIYSCVADVFDGKADPLEHLLKDNILTDFYNFADLWDYSELMELLSHSNPALRILEIGAGTGSLTSTILRHLKTPFGEKMFSKYIYTDISAGFFIQAKERFQDYVGIEYKTLDITQDPAAQGFEEGSFDLVVAANVLHATPKLSETLKNVRKLLHPKGRLFLQDLCPESKFTNYVMGVLPGWWLGEDDGRSQEPYVNPERWDKELRNAGFDGIEAVKLDHAHPYQVNANILARPTAQNTTATSPKRVTILTETEELSTNVQSLNAYLSSKGLEVDTCTLKQNPPAKQDIIAAIDLDGPFIHDISGKNLRDFINFVSELRECRMVWLTRSAQVDAKDPRYAMIVGLGRCIRSEMSLPLGVLELDELNQGAWAASFQVLEKLQRGDDVNLEQADPEYEFSLSHGLVHIGRFSSVSVTKELTSSEAEDTPRRLEIGRRGLLQTLQWAQMPWGELQPHEVEVDVKAVGMNFKDVLIAMGIVEGRPIEGNNLGCECAGIVRSVGSRVTNVQVGDRTVLIHSAAGGVGIAAMHVCQTIGAEIYATVGTPEKATFLTETFGISPDHIFNSRDETFRTDILAATNGRGVDLVLNSLSGELLHASWQCVAEFGIMVEIGKRDLIGHGKLALDIFEANRGYCGVDIAQLSADKPLETNKTLRRIVDMYKDGQIKPIHPITCFSGEAIEEAFRFLQKGQHIGKIVIKMPEDPKILPSVPVHTEIRFRPNASYLLVGGLGGLGQAVATWMAERGARSLVFLSRSAESTEKYGAFFEEMRALGCNALAVSGSVSNMEDVKRAVAAAAKPIAGVLQLSMVLRDQAFEKITPEEWQTVTEPKVQGTWNLHNALGENLDFFVMFSSFSGLVGQWGQAGYAAANTFLDAFAQYRHNLGLPASVLEIGCMEDVGYISQNPQVLETFRATAVHMLRERDLLESMELLIRRSPKISAETGGKKRNINAGFFNEHQMGIGLRSTRPLSDPENRNIWKRDRRFSVYRNNEQASTAAQSAGNEGLRTFLNGIAGDPSRLDAPASIEFLAQTIGARVNGFLMRSEDDEVDMSQTLAQAGVDSLIAIEIRNWFRQSLAVDISVLEMLNGVSIAQLARSLYSEMILFGGDY
ncbi:hypothetical protein GGI35DRAFT_490696 [Trichoderma velutinum]